MANLAKQNRVVVTGLGALAANGIGKDAFWDSLIKRESGIDKITLFDASGYSSQIAGEVRGFDFGNYTRTGFKVKRLARHTQLAIAATSLAIQDAHLDKSAMDKVAPIPVIVGISGSSVEVIENNTERLNRLGPKRVSPHGVSSCQPHAVAGAVAQVLKTDTTLTTIATACPAGLDAVQKAVMEIRHGKAELVVACGSDAPITPLTVASFGMMGMLPSDIEHPQQASRPFDRDRQGGILAEGAGVIILESLEHAIARGAKPVLEIMGYGSVNDRPEEESGTGLLEAMKQALANSCFLPRDIDYISAHGPSDPVIDRVETEMIKRVWGDAAYHIPVSSIKGVTGNPLAAAGVLQTITCAIAMEKGIIPPTANYENADPACDLDYVPKARRGRIRRALINLHGLGGGNSSLVVQRVEI